METISALCGVFCDSVMYIHTHVMSLLVINSKYCLKSVEFESGLNHTIQVFATKGAIFLQQDSMFKHNYGVFRCQWVRFQLVLLQWTNAFTHIALMKEGISISCYEKYQANAMLVVLVLTIFNKGAYLTLKLNLHKALNLL